MRKALGVCLASVGLSGGLAGCDEIKVKEGDPIVQQCNATVSFGGDPGAQTVVEDKELTIPFSATASDGSDVTYSLATQPLGATINSDTGVFTYTPEFGISDTTTNAGFDMKVLATIQPSGCTAVTDELLIRITVQNDLDEDGTADATDDDADGDGLSKTVETELGLDDKNEDVDGDNKLDGEDNCPKDSNESQDDLDDDDIGNQCDACPNDPENDTDGDDVCDSDDLCPGVRNVAEDCDNNTVTPAEQCDEDGDGLGEVLAVASGVGCDPCLGDTVNDPDGDKACATRAGEDYDNCPTMANPLDCAGGNVIDTDGNLTGAQCDADDDGFGDGFGADLAGCDPCPNDAGNDADDDGACNNGDDNCPALKNDDQLDDDDDGLGDACDPDIDGDSVANTADNCPNDANPLVSGAQPDNDQDGAGDACDTDDDDDEQLDTADNCPLVANANQLDPDDDNAGFQCDSLEEVPFSVHEGTAIVRVDGDAKAGTIALAFRGANPCTGPACVQPGAYVVDADDEELAGHFATGVFPWLDLMPPSSELLPPHVTQSGEALFASQGTAGFKLWRVDPATDTATAAFAAPGIFAPPKFYDAPDGLTLIETKITSAATPPAIFKLETAGQPLQVRSGQEFVDSIGIGPTQYADDTLYIPVKSSGTYTLVAYQPGGTAVVPTVKIGTPTVSVQSASDLQFVTTDPVQGSPWYCWQSTDTPSRTSYFQVHGGVIVHHRKTNWSLPCAQVQAHLSPSGTWFFVGPSTPVGASRLAYWAPDADADPSNDTTNPFGDIFGTTVAATFTFHFTNAHTFIQRDNGNGLATQDDDGAQQFYWFNPGAPTLPVELGNTPLFSAKVDVHPETNWFGVVGRTQTEVYDAGSLEARRYQGGISAAVDTRTVLATVQAFHAPNAVWIGPSGTMFVEYAAPGNVLQIVPRTLPVPSSPLTPVAAGKVNVTFHGGTTIVSYVTANGTGLLTTPNETTSPAKLDSLGVTIRGVHEAFQAQALRPGMADNFISYLDGSPPSGRYVVARIVTSPSVGLSTVLDSLTSPPQQVAMGPNNEVWFTYEKATGLGYGALSATAFTDFVSNMDALQVLRADEPDDDHLWGIVARRTPTSELYACRLPVTVGAVTSAANCWQASEASASALWSGVDDRNVAYVVSVAGSPAVVSLFQSVTETPLLPSAIP